MKAEKGLRRATDKQRMFAEARLAGRSRVEAHAAAGYSPRTKPGQVEDACIAIGILPDPEQATDELRDAVRTVEGMRAQASTELVEQLFNKRHEIVAALIGKAESGNMAAIEKALDRLIGRAPVAVEHSGPDGRPVELDYASLTDEERATRIIAILERAQRRADEADEAAAHARAREREGGALPRGASNGS